MTDLAPVYEALKAADAAGNTADAQRLAEYIRSQSAAPDKPGILTDVAKTMEGTPLVGKAAAGVVEPVLSAVTGAVAQPIAGLAGIAQGVFGEGEGSAARVVKNVQQGLTYQPRTEAGKAVSEIIAKPGELINRGTTWAAEKATDATKAAGASPEVAGAVGASVQMIPPALGIAAGAKFGGEAMAENAAENAAGAAAAEKVAQTTAAAAVKQAGFDWSKLGRQARVRLTQMAKEAGNLQNLDPKAVQRIARAESLPEPVKLTRGQATRSPQELRAEGQLSLTKEGAPIQERYLDQNAAMQKNIDLLKGQTKASAANAEEVGRRTTRALESARAQANNRVNKLYRQAETAGEAAAPITLDTAAAHNFVQHLAEHPEPEFVGFVANKLRNYVEKDPATGALRLKEGVTAIPINDLENTVKAANAIRRTDASTKGHYAGEVVKAIDAMIPEDAGGALYKQARAARRELAQKFDEPASISRLIHDGKGDRKVALEKVFDTAVASRGTSKAQLARLRDTLTKEGSPSTRKLGAQAWEDLRGQTLQYIKEKASKGAAKDAIGNPSLAPGALKSALDEIGNGKLELLLGKQAAKQLRDLAETAADAKTIPTLGPHLGSSTTSNALSLLDRFAEKLKRAPIGDLGRGAVGAVQEMAQSGARTRQVRELLGDTPPPAYTLGGQPTPKSELRP